MAVGRGRGKVCFAALRVTAEEVKERDVEVDFHEIISMILKRTQTMSGTAHLDASPLAWGCSCGTGVMQKSLAYPEERDRERERKNV